MRCAPPLPGSLPASHAPARWLPVSLGVALVVLAVSLSGGGSAVSPAGAQAATQIEYYHHEGGGFGEAAARIRVRAHPRDYLHRAGHTVTVTVTPGLGQTGCGAFDSNGNEVSTYELALPTTAGEFTDLTFTRNGPNRLVKRPVGWLPNEMCSYRVTFPPDEDGATNFYLLDQAWEDYDTTIGPALVGGGPNDGEAWARYANNPTPTEVFTGTLFVETSTDVARLTQFFVDIQQVTSGTGSTAPGCSQRQTARVRTQTPGDTVEHPVTLVHQRHGSNESCIYEVLWPDNEPQADAYMKDPAFSFTNRLSKALTDRNPPVGARGRYIANPNPTPLTLSRFAPAIAWNVPVTDYDGNGAHDYGATSPRTSITVRFSPAAESSTLSCSPADTAITYAIVPSTQPPAGESGSRTNFEATSNTTQLIDSPAGSRQRCRYTAVFDAGDAGAQSRRLTKVADASDDVELWGGEPEIAATYVNAEQTRSVTFRVGADAGANGLVFRVSFAAVSGAHGGCSATGNAEATVGSDGTGEASRDLIEWPEGHTQASHRCEYTISWDGSEAAATSTYPRFGSATDTLDGEVFDQSTPTMSKRYGAATYYWGGSSSRNGLEMQIGFTQAAVTHPQWWHPRLRAAKFTVEFEPTTRSPEGCSTGVKHTFQLDTQVTETSTQDWGFYGNDFVLSPPGTDEQCTYDIKYPAVEDGNTLYFILDPSRKPTGGTRISPSDNRHSTVSRYAQYTARTYSPTFAPQPTFVVPDLDFDGDGANDFSGTRLEVNYGRTNSFGDNACPRFTDITYVVNDDGSVAPTAPFTLPSQRTDPRLPCFYAITFPGKNPVNVGLRAGQLRNDTDLTHCPRLQTVVSEGASKPGVLCVRTQRTTTDAVFTANGADAGVPDGTVFTAEVTKTAGSHERCTANTTVRVVIGTDDSTATLELVDWPIDRWSRANQRCVYEVEWSTSEDSGSSYERDSNNQPTVSDNRDASESQWLHSAWYVPASAQQQQPPEPPMVQEVNPETMFTATLHLVAAPDVPGGTTFDVEIAPVSGSHGDCSTPPSTAMGAPSPDPAGFSDRMRERTIELVDVPAGEVDGCVYEVAWPMHERAASASTPAKYERDDTYVDRNRSLNAPPNRVRVAAARYAPIPEDDPSDGTGDPNTGDGNAGDPNDGNGGGSNGGTGDPNTGNPQNGDGNAGNANPPVSPPVSPPSATPGGASRTPGGGSPRSSGGGGGGGGGGSRSSGGGGGGGTTGGGSTGPWVVASTRVPVTVSLAMPARDFAVGTAIEVMLNVPGTCGEDVTAFAGLPANIGLVYALNARSGATVSVLAANALRLAGHAERDGETRDCDLRITLISAPPGCSLSNSQTDDAGRSYVELSGGDDITGYNTTAALTCR